MNRQPESMTLVDHLKELRQRLLKCLVAVLIGMVVVWVFYDLIFEALSKPYCDWAAGQSQECSFLITELGQPFSIAFSIAGYGGILVAMPVILYQFARFVTPALYPSERKAAIPFVLIGLLLLGAGVTAGYVFVPQSIDILLNFKAQDSYETALDVNSYVSLLVKLLVAFGLAAQLPLILTFLQKVGAIKNKTLRKNRRIAFLVIVIVGAVITPTGDPYVLAMVSVPMYVFYELAILIGARFSSQKALSSVE